MSDTRELEDPLVGTVVAGRYRIVSRLAAGGMGVVYEATQEPLGRRVALKVIRGDATHDPVAQLRFEREAKTASSIQDPHVVVVYDFGALGEGAAGLFIAMEFVEGQTLRSLLATGRVSWRKSLVIVEHIARALSAAHGKGLVHRDLKPENVMMTTSSAARGGSSGGIELHCKVLDFGLAKGIDEGLFKKTGDGQRLTGSGGFVGTPGYISPEHIDGAGEDPRQDIYALGIVWWEMLTARHPFPAETPMKTLLRQMHEEPPPLDDVVRITDGIPPAGAQLLRDMMAKSPRDRPRDGAAVLDRLLELTDGMSTRFDRVVDSNAPTLAGHRSDLDVRGHIDDIPTLAPRALARAPEVATVDQRLQRPLTSPTPASQPSGPGDPPQSTQPPATPEPTGGRRRRRPRRRLLQLVASASVLGTLGGVALVQFFETDPPEPVPPRPPVVVTAPAPVTEVVIEGLTSFSAMRAVREGLPEHALRVYRPGRTELAFDGDVAAAVADRLQGKVLDIGGAALILEVTELDRGRVLISAAPFVDAGVADLVDAGALTDAGAGPTVVAPDGLEP